MDRLSTVIVLTGAALLATGTGCEEASKDGASSSSPGRKRVAAVEAEPTAAPDLEAFCDVRPGEGEAPAFSLPELAGDAPEPAPGWRWVNLWASWCKPCVEEIPRMKAWLPELRQAGAAVTLQLVSLDETAEDMESYMREHPGTPPSLRAAEPDAVGAWLEGLGAAGFASIPVHVFVDPAGKVRCVRMTGVLDSDYPAIEALLAGG